VLVSFDITQYIFVFYHFFAEIFVSYKKNSYLCNEFLSMNKNMKKQYQQPDMEVVAINGASQMLAGSDKVMTVTGSDLHGGGPGGSITGDNKDARSDEYYDMDDDDLDW
jgi:hypothetical protein